MNDKELGLEPETSTKRNWVDISLKMALVAEKVKTAESDRDRIALIVSSVTYFMIYIDKQLSNFVPLYVFRKKSV